MYSLHPPCETPAADDAQNVVALFDLQAVVHGTAYPLSLSPDAIDRMHIHGIGVFQHPRTERLFTPCRCKLMRVSPDRSVWVFALPHELRLRIEIRTDDPIPYAFAVTQPGTLLEQGAEFAQLNPQLTGSDTMVITTVRQVISPGNSIECLASPISGKMSAIEDTIIRLYTLPIASPHQPEAQPTPL